jgi:alpha-tubulin suppressor-like RCC1 family protein
MVFILLLLTTLSCSKKGQQVDTNISITSFIGGSTFSGGVMIWGIGPNEKKMAISLLNESDAKEMLLDSGLWSFYATGWTGANQLEGAMSCAFSEMDLSPENPNVNLSMKPENCINTDFAPTNFTSGNEFNTIKFIICNDINGKVAGDNCDSTEKGTARSFRFVFKSIDEDNNELNGLSSACIDETDANSITQTTFKIPVGNIDIPLFAIGIETFSNTGCIGSNINFEFPQGLLSGSNVSHVFSNSSITEIFLESQVIAPSLSGYSNSSAVYNENISIANNSVSNIGGVVSTYTIVPALPSGLAISAATGIISGTPTSTSALATYTVTATGPSGATSTTSLDITILEELPIISSYTDVIASYLENSIITVNSPAVSGGAIASYSIAPALPTGLTLNTTTGTITGTPTVLAASAVYTVTATNGGGVATIDVTIEVVAAGVLTFDSTALHDFGSVTTGVTSSSLLITVTNSGGSLVTAMTDVGLSAPFLFQGGYPGTGGDCSATLSPGVSCTLAVDYSPTVTGLHTSSIDLSYHDGNVTQNTTKPIQGTGMTPANLTISESDAYDFSSVTIGATSEHTFTISNTGESDATAINDTALTGTYQYKGGSFPGIGGTCNTITPLGGSLSCTVIVEYIPPTALTHNATINIDYNNGQAAANTPRTLTGTGITPALLSFDDGGAYDFGIGELYESIPFNDQGTWDAGGNSPSLADGVGTASDYYKVSAAGTQNLGSGDQVFAINDLLVYSGSAWVKRSPPKVHLFTVTNSGGSTATSITGGSLFTPFRFSGAGATFPGNVNGDCLTTLPSGGSCTVEVEVTSTSIGINNLNLDISYNDGASAQVASINMMTKGGFIISAASTQDSKCIAFNNGVIKCWGGNIYGQLGRSNTLGVGAGPGEMGNILSTVSLQGAFEVKELAGGNNHFCALSRDGDVKCWGRNQAGQLGLGDVLDRGDGPSEMGGNLPSVNLGTGMTAKRIRAAGDFTCAILNNDKVKCWGENGNGQLGIENTSDKGSNPADMGDNLQYTNLGTGMIAKDLTLGNFHACAILADDSIKCWGRGNFGAISSGTTQDVGDNAGEMGDNLPFVSLGGPFTSSVAAGPNHTCSILSDNTLKCWGFNSSGQLGLENTTNAGSTSPTMALNLAVVDLAGVPVQIITSHDNEVCALLAGTVKCWGDGSLGGLGKGTVNNLGDGVSEMGVNLTAIDFGAGRSVIKLFPKTTCALLDNHELKCWGRNDSGQLGLGDTLNRGDGAGEMGDSLPAVELR